MGEKGIKIELPEPLAGGDEKHFHAQFERVRAALQSLSEVGGTNADAILQAAADLKEIKESRDEMRKEVARQKDMVESFTRLVPGQGSDKHATLLRMSLGAMPLLFDPSKFTDEKGQKLFKGVDPWAGQLMSFNRQDFPGYEEEFYRFVARWQGLRNDIHLAHRLLMSAPVEFERYQREGGWTKLPYAKAYQEMTRQIQAALSDSGAATGTEWDPTGVGFTLMQDLRPDFELMSYIPSVPLPRSPITYPVQGAYFRGRRISEPTSDTEASNTAIGARTPTTINVTFTAQEYGAITYYSQVLEEDSIVPLVTAVNFDLGYAEIASRESPTINGQLTGMGSSPSTTSTFDTGEAFDNSGGDIDDRSLWDGLRYFSSLTGANLDAGGTLVVDHLSSLKGALRRFGKNASQGVWLTGYAGWARLLTLKGTNGDYMLVSRYKNPNATLETGDVADLMGSPVCVSDVYPENLNASGVIDGASNTTSLLYFNRTRFRMGQLRLARIESSREFRFSTNQTAVKITARGQMKPVRTPAPTGASFNGETSVGTITNISI